MYFQDALYAHDKEEHLRRTKREQELARKLAEKRSKRERRHKPVVSRIPWHLLDELEHEKWKLKAEKAVELTFGSNV